MRKWIRGNVRQSWHLPTADPGRATLCGTSLGYGTTESATEEQAIRQCGRCQLAQRRTERKAS